MALVKTIYEFEVFKMAYALAIEVRPMVKDFLKYEQFGGVADQMRRASTGICANLAEGFGKNQSKAEFRRFVMMALGSANEMELWLRFACDFEYLDPSIANDFINRYARISKMLQGLGQSLES